MLAPTPKNLSLCQNLELKIHRLKVHFIKSKMSRLTVCNFLPLDGAHCIKFNFSDRSIGKVSKGIPSDPLTHHCSGGRLFYSDFYWSVRGIGFC